MHKKQPAVLFCGLWLLCLAPTLSLSTEHQPSSRGFGSSWLRGRGRALLEEPQAVPKFPSDRWPSLFGQDWWVLCWRPEPGYYVDIGAHDSKGISNTWALDGKKWTGLCVEPYPTNWAQRRCSLEKALVYNETGVAVDVAKRSGGWVAGIEHLLPGGVATSEADSMEQMTTVSTTDLLEKHDAPAHMQYLDLDTDGSELEVLQGIDWGRYSFDLITVATHRREPQRQQVRDFLAQHGYQLEVDILADDFFIHTRLGPLDLAGCGETVKGIVMRQEFEAHPGFFANTPELAQYGTAPASLTMPHAAAAELAAADSGAADGILDVPDSLAAHAADAGQQATGVITAQQANTGAAQDKGATAAAKEVSSAGSSGKPQQGCWCWALAAASAVSACSALAALRALGVLHRQKVKEGGGRQKGPERWGQR